MDENEVEAALDKADIANKKYKEALLDAADSVNVFNVIIEQAKKKAQEQNKEQS